MHDDEKHTDSRCLQRVLTRTHHTVCSAAVRSLYGDVTPVAMSSAAAARVTMHEAVVERLSAVRFDEPGAARDFAAFVKGRSTHSSVFTHRQTDTCSLDLLYKANTRGKHVVITGGKLVGRI